MVTTRCPNVKAREMVTGVVKLRDDIEGIFEYLEGTISGYGYLKWNEVAMLKADMMNVRRRWLGLDVETFRARCRQAGMTMNEATEVVGYLQRAQAGRRLVPERSYRDFRFRPDPPTPDSEPIRTSRVW